MVKKKEASKVVLQKSFFKSMKISEVVDLRDDDGAIDYYVDTELGEFAVAKVGSEWQTGLSKEVRDVLIAFVIAYSKKNPLPSKKVAVGKVCLGFD